jgi:RNA polymerase sigma-70 factor (ECF subfamily)
MRWEPAKLDRLMDSAASGDDEAFATLAEAMQDELFRFALAHGASSADAAETVQETLLRAYRRREDWRIGGSAAAWLHGIAMNVVREFARKRRRWTAEIDPDSLAAPSATSPADGADRHDRRRRLAAAIAALPARQREAVACRFLRRMSVRQTAAAMGCAEGTVKATVFSALANLRRALRERADMDDRE